MKHWFCTLSAAAFLASGPVFAADLGHAPPPAPLPPPVPVFTWAGPYVGGDIGYVWTNDGSKYFSNPPFVGAPTPPVGSLIDTASLNSSGIKGGAFAGYNWQLSNGFVVGVEADIEASSLSKTNPFRFATGVAGPAGPIAAPNGENIPWEGSLRGRLGYAAGNALFYVTGGLAFAQINTKYLPSSGLGTDSFSHTQTGWTLGAGIDYALSANWIARAEYRYAQFDTFRDTLSNSIANPGGLTARHSVSENVVRIGIAYKFGSPAAAAVIAQY